MNPSAVHYRAPLGASVRILTVVAYLILFLVGAGAAFTLLVPPVPRFAGYLALGTVAIIAIGSFAFRIHGYILTGRELMIRYGFGGRSVRLDDITSIEPARDVFRGAWRVFASGGLWSFLGRFQGPQVGPFLAYVSDPGRAVMISTPGNRVVVSPEDPAGFIGELKRRRSELP